MNSFLTAKFDNCGKNKHDAISRKLSNAKEKVRGMLKAEFMKWLFRFDSIKLRLQLRYYFSSHVAAFDTIDHSIMLYTLANRFGIKGKTLQWFESYLSYRRQAVVVKTKSSSCYDLPFGVPQGSVLGPILFTLYISPIGDSVQRHNKSYHTYADDTQLHLSFRAQNCACMAYAKSSMELCVHDIKMWIQSHFLKLNGDKTELFLVHFK